MVFAIWNRTIQDDKGNVQGGASVEVRDANTNALATLYSDRDGTTLKTNPFLTNTDGHAYFFVIGGAYNVTAKKGAFQMTFPYEAVGTAAEYDFTSVIDGFSPGIYNDKADVTTSIIPTTLNAIRLNGYYSAGDGGGALYKRVSLEPTHAGKIQSSDGAWWELAECDVTVEMFGGIGGDISLKSSLPDSSQAFKDAILYASIKGSITIYARNKCYRLTNNVVIGNGTETSISSHNNIKIIGGGGQVTTGEFAPLTSGTYIFYDGSTLVNTGVFRVDGAVYGLHIEGFLLDANGKLPFGLDVIHMYRSFVKNVATIGWTWRGFNFRTWNASLFSGVTQGFMSNEFVGLSARQPAPGAQAGIYMNGNAEFNIGFSRNKFSLCDFAIPNLPTGVGMYWGMIDNNSFDRCFCFYTSGEHYGDGVGIFMERGGPLNFETTFPSENIVINSPIYGGVSGQSGVGGNIFIGYPTADGAPIPNMEHVYVLTFDGHLRNFNGRATTFVGKTDPENSVGAFAATKYLFPQGMSRAFDSRFDADIIVDRDISIIALSINLSTAPGSGVTRTFTVVKNGVGTSAFVSFSGSESGTKTFEAASAIKISKGDSICIMSDVSGGIPTNAVVSYSIDSSSSL